MSRELIHPNLHAVLIHVPLGLLVVGTFIELLAPVLWRRSTVRAAGRWMILLGALSLLPTASAGLYAMADLNGRGKDMASSWSDIRAASPIQGHAWEMMVDHAKLNFVGAVALLLLVVIWLSGSDKFRSSLHFIFLLLLLGDVGAIIIGSWHGGEMVYRYGIGVDTTVKPLTTQPMIGAQSKLTDFVDPIELHVILGAAALAAGLAGIGVAMRGAASVATSSNYLQQQQQQTDIGYAINPAMRPPASQYGGAAQLHPDIPGPTPTPERLPVGRVWLLAALIGICAALAGWWSLAAGTHTWDPKSLWQNVSQDAESHDYRRLVHVVCGVSIVVLMLLLALVGRAAGKRVVIAFFALILLAATAAQGWIGSLMLLDTTSGPLQRLNISTTTTKPSPPTAETDISTSTEAAATAPSSTPTTSSNKPAATEPASHVPGIN